MDADPAAGFNFPYFLYAPPRYTEDPRPLLVEPNNTGTTADDFVRHRTEAAELARDGLPRWISDELRLPLLVPVFPRPRSGRIDWRYNVQALDTETIHIESGPLERVDLQLLAMVADARERLAAEGFATTARIAMNGFSTSAKFVNRFTALHPDAVTSAAAGAINGLAILPIEEAAGHTLNYQIGVADVESITGDPFDLERFREVDQFVYMGTADENDPLPNDDTWSDRQRAIAYAVYGEDMQADRFPYCESVYASVGADAEFRLYEGAGHEITDRMRREVVAFHRRSIDFDPPEATLLDRLEVSTGVDWLAEGVFGGSLAALAVGGGYLYRRRSGDDDD